MSKPPGSGTHGAASDDCVAVWFFWRNVNAMMSPATAFCCRLVSLKKSTVQIPHVHTTTFGVKAITPAPPTVTLNTVPKAVWPAASSSVGMIVE